MVPIWSSANIGGISLSSISGFTKEVGQSIFDFTKKSGAEVIRLKAVEHNHEYYQQLLAEDPFPDNPDLRTTALTAAENALQELHAIQDAHWWVEHREAVLEFVKYRIAAAIHAFADNASGKVRP